MKKIIFGVVTSMLLSTALYAGDSKKTKAKHVAKKQICTPANCANTANCNPANCVSMPGCCKH